MIRFTLLLLMFSPFLSYASLPASGIFEPDQHCPTYLSRDHQAFGEKKESLEPTKRYIIHAVNHHNPKWFRVEVNGSADLRWVRADCGNASYTIQKKTPCDDTPGLADSHVLALSWQPAYCETYGYRIGKPECTNLAADSYPATHLTLHGLWPNQTSCGIHYSYCGVSSRRNHCSYAPVVLSKPVSLKLKQFMPSYAHGSCLERHEWNRHGTCQVLSSNDYFALALRLTEELNQSSFALFLQKNRGDVITLKQLQGEFEKALGEQAGKKVFFGCKNGRLVDVYVQLPALIPHAQSLQQLVANAEMITRRNGCPKQIMISDFYGKSE